MTCGSRLGAILSILLAVVPARADDETLREIGDVLQYALPAAGGATATILQDWEGLGQWGASLGTQLAIQSTIKTVVDKTRPNRGSQSFPSGHSAAAWMGASFIQRRYGWEYGIPAYALAVLTSYSRVEATKHDFWDVTGGAVIGVASTYIFTTPYEVGDTAFRLTPIVGEDVFGLQITLGEGVRRPLDQLPPPRPKPFNENRLRNVQVITGTDPTLIINRLELKSSLIDASGEAEPSAQRITGTRTAARLDWAITPQHLLGAEIAMVTNSEPAFGAVSGGRNAGFGDVLIRYRFKPYENIDAQWYEPRAVALSLDQLLPTGSLGHGTGGAYYLVAPSVVAAWTPINNFNVYPGIAYYWSVWQNDNPGVHAISTIGLGVKLEFKWENGVYVSWDPEFLIPLTGGETVADHLFEIGWRINRQWGLFFEYGLYGLNPTGLNGTNNFRDRFYDDSYTFGVRWFY